MPLPIISYGHLGSLSTDDGASCETSRMLAASVAVDAKGTDDVVALAQSCRNCYLFKMHANGSSSNDNPDILVQLMAKADKERPERQSHL